VLCPSRHRRVVHAASGGWLWCSISVVAACCHMRVLLLHDTCSKYCRECLYSILIRQLALQSGALVGKIPWLVTTTRGHQHWRSVVPSSAVQCATILCEILLQQNCEDDLPEVARSPIVGAVGYVGFSRWGNPQCREGLAHPDAMDGSAVSMRHLQRLHRLFSGVSRSNAVPPRWRQATPPQAWRSVRPALHSVMRSASSSAVASRSSIRCATYAAATALRAALTALLDAPMPA
jgi:hypothetical protein